jgi:eukaryotic-like serine/threonine-protein kinase
VPTNRRIAHFELLEQLGSGGMAVVYRALDQKLEREVALKLIHDDRIADPTYRARLLREARSAAAVRHPAVATGRVMAPPLGP